MNKNVLEMQRDTASPLTASSLHFVIFTFFSLPPVLPGSIWNAASFYQESSYLYFPTLQAELASDISFYFKTSAPSGVFLENQGLKDFIRVELSCECTLCLQYEMCNTHKLQTRAVQS